METMTYDEMSQLNGGGYVCAIASVGLAAAEMGVVGAIGSGGASLVISVVGLGAALYGFYNGCFG